MPANARFWSRKRIATCEAERLGRPHNELFTQKRSPLLTETTVKGRPATQDDALTGNPNIRSAASFAARSARLAGMLVITASMAAASATSFAQTVPVPKPAPKGRDG